MAAVEFDLVDEDDRVALNHAHEGDDAQQGHEAEWPVQRQQGGGHARDAQRAGQKDQHGAAERLQLEHEQREGDEQHDGHAGGDGGGAFAAFFGGAGHFQAVAGRLAGPARLQLAQGGQQLRRDGGAFHAPGHVALHGDGVFALVAPHHARLPGQHGRGDLRQRNGFAAGGGHVSAGQAVERAAFAGGLAQGDVDELVALAVLAHGRAVLHDVQRLRDGLAGHAQRARLGLVDLQAQRFDGLVPVVVHVAHVRIGAQGGLDFVGVGAQLLRIRPDHAELHRVIHGRPAGQELDACARFRKFLRQQGGQAAEQVIARGHVLRQHDELRHVALRHDLVQRQVKARHARANPHAHAGSARRLPDALFHARGHVFSGREAGAFGQPERHQDFGARGVGEKLLLHPPHARHAQRKHQRRGADGQPAPPHAPGHQAAKGHVKRRVEIVMQLAGIFGRIFMAIFKAVFNGIFPRMRHVRRRFQKPRAQKRNENHRSHPAGQ